MSKQQTFFATAALGLESLLAAELIALGAEEVKEERAGASFVGDLATAYRVCLWSRLASRVLLPIANFPASDPDELYAEVQKIDWTAHLLVSSTFVVDCTTIRSQINHTRYGALRVKDAIVDQFRARDGERPSISLERPDLRINLHLFKDQATLSIDLAGDSLHRRGYRIDGVHAPLKENLAAAILIRGGWPQIAEQGGVLVDPMCGSGTLPLEAGLMATDSAPGLLRDYFGFLGWLQFDAELWQRLREEALERQNAGMQRKLAPIVGYDGDGRAVKAAWQHAQNAGLDKIIHFEKRTLREFTAPLGFAPGLLVANPPYGERLGEESQLSALYNQLGEKMAVECSGWKAAVITSNPQLGRSIGLRAGKINTLYNGAIKCQLLQFELDKQNRWQSLAEGAGKPVKKELSPGAEMFANRLRKNLKKFKKWAKKQEVDCYRLYDADLPEYAVAVDIYDDEVHLQEYRAPKDVDPKKAAQRLLEIQEALPQVLDIAPTKIHLKVREQQKGKQQYEKQSRRGILKEVQEGNCRFLVNLTDYLDTGLFLDHRPIRRLIQDMSHDVRFLNLFAYTGAATVHALMGGARKTTTVDMSRTYLEWAQKNIALNDFDRKDEELIQADCMKWLDDAQSVRAASYDLIFLDPPTFSNSKSMETTFDIQRDHVDLLGKVANLLAPGGTLVFSNNLRNFKLDVEALPNLQIENLGNKMIPLDYERNPRIHNCWLIRNND